MADDDKKLDELLAKAKRLREATEQPPAEEREKKLKESPIVSAVKDAEAFTESVSFVRKCINIATQGAIAVYNIFKPVVNNPVTRFIGRTYMKAFNKFCYKKDKKTGEKKLSRPRTGAFLTASFCLAAAAVPGIPGHGPASAAVGAVVSQTMDAVRMTGTALLNGPVSFRNGWKNPQWDGMELNHRTFYLNDVKETDPTRDVYSVKGCEEIECDETNSVYFRVKPGIPHHAWAWTKGKPAYIPDLVVGPIAPGLNKCEVTYYGARWRAARYLQAWPILLDAKCTHINVRGSLNSAAAPGQQAATAQQQVAAPVRAPVPVPP